MKDLIPRPTKGKRPKTRHSQQLVSFTDEIAYLLIMKRIDMARIGPGKNTRPERVVRMFLVRSGVRHTCNDRSLPGSPDLVVTSRRTAIFVDGRFWHCPNSKAIRISDMWRDKIKANVRRDKRQRRRLRSMGWRVIRIWDSDLRSDSWMRRIAAALGL